MYVVRTDLAIEAADTSDGKLPEGVSVDQDTADGIERTTVRIRTEGAAMRLGRPIGDYYTFEAPIQHADEALVAQVSEALGQLLPEGTILVVGLGNRSITPDALGPATAHQVIATRHIPAETSKAVGLPPLRPVCSLAPGVMGQTGIETSDIIKAVVADVKPAAVVVVDALAARGVGRLGATVQLSNSGIAPGAGVENCRTELSERTLGVPVLSLGIPTVVDGGTLVQDLAGKEDAGRAARALMVTPRDIDRVIEKGARVLAEALNRALFPNLGAEEIALLMD